MTVASRFHWRDLRGTVPSALVVALLGLTSCSGSSEPPDAPPFAATLSPVEGIGLQAPAGTVLPAGPTVEVRNQFGEPMEGITVSFQVQEGGGFAVIPALATDEQGRARSTWILGPDPDTHQVLRASVDSLILDFTAEAIQPVVGQSYYGRNHYVEYFPGNLPLVLSAPHGGTSEPEEIPDRTYGTLVRDTNVKELALQARFAIFAATGGYPHVVVSHLRRTKLDPNREIVEAAQGDPEAERAWWEYHSFIANASDLVESEFGAGLYIDLHGHGHEIPRLELGYMLSSSDLDRSDESLNSDIYIEKSSFRGLAGDVAMDFASLIRGPLSLGTLMEAQGFPSVPSQSQPDPDGAPFFSGGYSTDRHGSRAGGVVSGVQIECNYAGVRDTPANQHAFGAALAEVLDIFFPATFGFPFATQAGSSFPTVMVGAEPGPEFPGEILPADSSWSHLLSEARAYSTPLGG